MEPHAVDALVDVVLAADTHSDVPSAACARADSSSHRPVARSPSTSMRGFTNRWRENTRVGAASRAAISARPRATPRPRPPSQTPSSVNSSAARRARSSSSPGRPRRTPVEAGVDHLAVAGLQVVDGQHRFGGVEPGLQPLEPRLEPVAGHARTAAARVR